MQQPKKNTPAGLPPEKREQLDANIKSMLSNGASKEDVMLYASDFKEKFGLKKKSSSASTSTPTAGPSVSETATSDIIEPKEPSVRELYNQNITLTDNDQKEIESRFRTQDNNDPEKKTRKQIENDILFRKKEEFLETLDKSQLSKLQQEEIKKIDSLESANRQIDFEIGLLDDEAKKLQREVERMNFSVEKAKNEGKLTKEGSLALQQRYNEIYNRSKEIEQEYKDKVEKFNSNNQDIGDFSKELDLFKRNWDVWDNSIQTMKLVGARGINGFMQTWNDLGEADQELTGGAMGNVVEAFQGDEFIKQIEKEEQYLKPKRSVTELETAEDVGEYAVEAISEQVPILMQIMSTGIGTIGVGAFGSKKQEFERENEDRRAKGKEEISDSAVIAASLAAAGNETIGAVVDKIGLKLAGRTIASIGTRTIKEPMKQFGKQLLLEEGEEVLFGTWSNNAIDKYVMGKDVDIMDGTLDVIAKTGITVGLLNGTPAVSGHVVGKFTDATDKKTLTENIGRVKELQTALESTQNEELKNSLQTKIDGYLKQNKDIINKTRLKINSLPEETLKQLAEIERNQGKQRDAITEIEKDPNIDPDTKQKLIGEFTSDIEQNEQSKQALLNAKEETPTTQKAEPEVLPEQAQKVQEISIDELSKYVEYDRETQPRDKNTPNKISELTEDIKKNGVKEPLQLNLYNGKAILVEGNHRIVAAKNAGLKTVPVEIVDETSKLNLEDGLTINPTKILHQRYAEKAKPFTLNETAPTQNTDVDGNVQPETGPVSDTTSDQDVQTAVEPTTSQATTEINTPRTYKLSDSDRAPEYKVEFKEGVLSITDPKGKEPSSKTKRKVMEKYADDFDFSQGERAVIPDGFDGNVNEFVANNSNNPLEIAQLLNDTNTDQFIENQVDFKTRIIADAIQGRIERSSYADTFGDKNNIGINMAKSYFAKKGEGQPIDIIAQELSEDHGIEVTPQDIVDHMEKYQGGRNDVYKEVRDEFVTPLKDAFTRTTGLPATNKFISKAIESQRSNDTDYQLTDIYSDQELLNLLDEKEQATEQQAAEAAQTTISDEGRTTRESGRQDEARPRIQEEGRTDGRVQETAAERAPIPERSAQEELRGSDEADSQMGRATSFIGGRLEETAREGEMTNAQIQDAEAKAAIEFAESEGVWIDNQNSLGQVFSSGQENNNYLNTEERMVYKVNNLMNSQTIGNLFKSIELHNKLFPETSFEFVGFTGEKNRLTSIQPVFKQKLIDESVKAEPSEIKAYMESIGFEQRTPESYYNGQYLVFDLYPRNVLKDANGTIYVIDAEFKEVSEPTTETNNETETKPISPEEKRELSKIEKKLNQWENDLKKFGDETLGINIPIAIARTAIQAMKAAIKAGKTLQQVIETGIETIQKTNWYAKLSKSEKAEINPSSLMESLKKSVEDNNAITNQEAKEKTDAAFKKARERLENKIPLKQATKKAIRTVIKKFSDRQFISKKLMDGIGAQSVKDLMINSHGMSGKAKRIFDDAYKTIYGKLSDSDRNSLDEIIQLRRFITIDKNRFEKGLPQVLHPDFIDADTAQKSLDQYKEEMGEKKFNDLNKRADAYFKQYRELLKAMRKNGLISEEVFQSLDGLDYQPRLFLQHITDFEGSVSLGGAVKEKSDTGGLSEDQIKAIDEGSDGSLVTNSEWLLSTSLVSRLRAMAMNNINREFITKEYPKAKKRYENLKGQKDLTREEQRFINYFEELDSKIKIGKFDKTPRNFKKAYWYENGVQKTFYIEEELHESWFNNTKGFLSPNWKEGISYISGSALLKGIATGNNPAFAIVNTPRDFLFTSIFSLEYSDFVPKAMLQVAKDAYKGVKEIKNSKKDTTGKNLFNKYIEYGGDMAFLSTQGRLKKNTMLARAFNKMLGKRAKDQFKNIFSAVSLREFSTYSEIMFRMALFQRSIKNELKSRGYSLIEDIQDQSEVDQIYNHAVANARSLLDFNQGGSVTKDWEAIVPYINTAVQGTRVAADAFAKDPTTTTMRVLQAGVLGTSFTMGMALTAISLMKGDDDEDKSAIDIYLDAMEGISPYQKMQYFNIPTGQKNADGEYRVLKVAKTHQMIPIFQFTDNMATNVLMKVSGREEKSMKQIGGEVFDAFNTNISPVSLNSPQQTVTRNPMMKAILTYATGYDFYRDQPLAYNVNKDPEPLEGQSMKNVEDFYKKLGREHNLSPVRVKGAVESFLTTPNTNPFVGILYGGADAISSDKDLEKIGEEFTRNLFKSTGKRIVSYTSNFNRSLYKMRKFKEEEEKLRIEEGFDLLDQKDLVKKFSNGDISQDEFMDGLEGYSPFEKKKIVNRFVEYKTKEFVVDRNIIDIKYAGTAKLRALMILNRYGDIFDGSEESNKVINQMNIAKGILTEEVLYEYQKLKNEVEK
jgi:hypothetical protein